MNRETLISKYLHFDFGKCLENINKQQNQFELRIPYLVVNKENNFLEKHNSYHISSKILSTDINKQNLIIICIKDNSDLLNFCLQNIYKNDAYQYCDVLVIDDRPSSTANVDVIEKYNGTSYCKITNTDNIFNYSVINNIAASYAKYLGKKRLIFWNSDIWTNRKNTLPNLIEKHINNKSDISGTKLIYPSQNDYNVFFGKYNHILGKNLQKVFLTIQHGGIIWGYQKIFESLYPTHQWRFYDRNHDLACIDTRCFAVTGALHIINLESFMRLGGYGISFAVSFQDIDLCQRAAQAKMKIYYLGTEEMFHAETITNTISYNLWSTPMITDNILYKTIWSKELPKLLGYSQ